MDIFHNIAEWQRFRRQFPIAKKLGFVPTMGNLHQGHASLFSRSLKENDSTLASIFINPTQFNHQEDFKHYPRTINEDLALLEKLGVDYCLLPEEKELYQDDYRYQIQESQLSLLMEGQFRPGHFSGVLTVVMKLLNLVKPQRAYFGEKDYQQYLMIHDMCEAFFIDTEIIACTTVRESSGLACSSRNNRLTSEQRKKADRFAAIFHQHKSCEQITADLSGADISLEYIEEKFNRRFAAVMIDGIRLIDNYAL